MSIEDLETPEEMAGFFDLRAEGYDDYLHYDVFTDAAFTQFYNAVSSPIQKTDKRLNIMDLGCGTGIEFESLFRKAPDVQITGVDLSSNMLELMQTRYKTRVKQISIVRDSFLTMPFEPKSYDYVISVLAVHHILRDAKLDLYKRILAALKPDGKYIEGDSVIPRDMESQFAAEHREQLALVPEAEDGHYHVDVPFSMDTQRDLLLEAGFKDFELVWQRDSTLVWNMAVYTVTA